MAQIKIPDVSQKSGLLDLSVNAAATIPAFIGITEKAQNGFDSLLGTPWKITSMTEFRQYFGEAPLSFIRLSVVDAPKKDEEMSCSLLSLDGTKALKVEGPENSFPLYYNMVMFFANGGSSCYIVSVGTYADDALLDKEKVERALTALEQEREVSIIVVPEAASAPDCKEIQRQMLAHCGKMKYRFAILDVQPKVTKEEDLSQQIGEFRRNVGENFLSYGAAYYPWLNTSVFSDMDDFVLVWTGTSAPDLTPFFPSGSMFPKYFEETCSGITAREKVVKSVVMGETGAGTALAETPDCMPGEIAAMRNRLHKAMMQNFFGYKQIVNIVQKRLNLLPPSAAMAGLYAMVDNTYGIWKAPANVPVNYVISPSEYINDAQQEELSLPMDGKAVNVIRAFPGEGVKVWGARTLDGNSQQWRYVNVRRTMMFLEESVRNVLKAYVLEPDQRATLKGAKFAIDDLLHRVWERGGLAGSSPEEAYEIHVEPGETMTERDLLDGMMRITLSVAVTHPGEFFDITIEQQMKRS